MFPPLALPSSRFDTCTCRLAHRQGPPPGPRALEEAGKAAENHHNQPEGHQFQKGSEMPLSEHQMGTSPARTEKSHFRISGLKKRNRSVSEGREKPDFGTPNGDHHTSPARTGKSHFRISGLLRNRAACKGIDQFLKGSRIPPRTGSKPYRKMLILCYYSP